MTEPGTLIGGPIHLNASQEKAAKDWAADDRLWTTQDTVEVNLRTFARVILQAQVTEPVTLPEGIERLIEARLMPDRVEWQWMQVDRPIIYAPESVRLCGVVWYRSAFYFCGHIEQLSECKAEIRALTPVIERDAEAWRRLEGSGTLTRGSSHD